MTTTPARVEWLGPEGWTVRANEDGVHLRSRSGEMLEAADVTRLINLIIEARTQMEAGQIPAPKPPTSDEIREYSRDYQQEHMARTAARAVKQAIHPNTDPTPAF